MKIMNIAYGKEYEKDGEIKKHWLEVGKLFVYEDGGMQIKLESIPVDFNGKLSVFEQKEKEDIPF